MREVHEPLRVVVAGNSCAQMVAPTRERPMPGTYGEQLAPLLAERGCAAVVEHACRWFGLIDELRGRYEEAVRNRFPDVVVLHYGIIEAQPAVLPVGLARHATAWNRSGAALPRAYRQHVAPSLWRALRAWQRAASARSGLLTWRRTPARFSAELRQLVRLVRADTGALVLVVDIDPPGARLEHWLPGYRRRWQIYQETLRATSAELGREHPGTVRLVEASADAAALGEEAVLPDGMHRSALGHRLLAERLVREIAGWLSDEG